MSNNDFYYQKYLKYKIKYEKLIGGNIELDKLKTRMVELLASLNNMEQILSKAYNNIKIKLEMMNVLKTTADNASKASDDATEAVMNYYKKKTNDLDERKLEDAANIAQTNAQQTLGKYTEARQINNKLIQEYSKLKLEYEKLQNEIKSLNEEIKSLEC